MLEEIKYEELCGIKNILVKYHGDDPVMIKMPEVDGSCSRIMTAPMFWVHSNNDLVHDLKDNFPNKVDVQIDSLDKPIEAAV